MWNYRPSFLLLCLHVVLLPFTLSQGVAQFQYPRGRETFNIFDTIVVDWTSTYNSPALFGWATNGSTPGGYAVVENDNVSSSGQEVISLNIQIPSTYQFPLEMWFDLIYNISDPDHQAGTNGEKFNVVSVDAVATTWALTTTYTSLTLPSTASGNSTSSAAAATTSATRSSTTSATVVAITSSTATAATSSSPTARAGSDGLSKGDKIGIGVGVPLGVLVVAALAAWAIISHRRIKKLERRLTGGSYSEYESHLASKLGGAVEMPEVRTTRD